VQVEHGHGANPGRPAGMRSDVTTGHRIGSTDRTVGPRLIARTSCLGGMAEGAMNAR
jgi:hypothetical protein